MQDTVEETIKVYVEALEKAGDRNVTISAPDMLACLQHLTGAAPASDIQSKKAAKGDAGGK
jgi:hypothetical protein